MPEHDPVILRQDRSALAWSRYRSLMKWSAVAAVAAVGAALLYLGSSGEPMPFSMVVATIAGVGLSVLLGAALMGLVFLSNASGHDEDAGGGSGIDE
jgi:hypothetical protein